MSLRSELKEIDGVGDATADKILKIIRPHLASEEAAYHLRQTQEYLDADRVPQAMEHLRKAMEAQ